MSNANATSGNGIVITNVTAPGSGSAYALLSSLLTGPAAAKLVGKNVLTVLVRPVTTTVNIADNNAGLEPCIVSADVNTEIPVIDPLNKVYIRSTAAGTVTVGLIILLDAAPVL